MSKTLGIIAMMFMCTPLTAQELYVQLGAYKDVANANLSDAEYLGSIHQEALSSGLTRIRVTGLANRDHARTVLEKARAAGYNDAFIGGFDTVPASTSSMEIPAYAGPSDQRINAARAKVPASEHHNIVFLDGKLVLKEGESFRPLE